MNLLKSGPAFRGFVGMSNSAVGRVTDQFPIGMRVLAVDDDPVCLKVLETLLRRCQYHGAFLQLTALVSFSLQPTWIVTNFASDAAVVFVTDGFNVTVKIISVAIKNKLFILDLVSWRNGNFFQRAHAMPAALVHCRACRVVDKRYIHRLTSEPESLSCCK